MSALALAWVDFHQSADRSELERYRALVASLYGTGKGVRIHGPASACSHFGDIARLAQVPVQFLGGDFADAARAPEATIIPPVQSTDILSRWNRANARANVRLLVRVSDIVRDEAGNVRSATIEHLDGTAEGVRWVSWDAGKRICFNGFRVELRGTKRAGLHFRVGVVIEDSPRDCHGYRTIEPRFISTIRIENEGVIAIRPHDPIEPAISYPKGSLPEDKLERETLREAVLCWYGAPIQEVDTYLSGRGLTVQGRRPDYAQAA